MKPFWIPLAAPLLLLACGPKELWVVMNAQNNSGQSGIATLTELGAKTRVVVVIHKSDSPDPQPVHFHPGRCGEISAKVNLDVLPAGLPSMEGPTAAHVTAVGPPPANDGGIVYTQTTIDVPISKLNGGDYVINVHDSRDFSLYVSCGNIN